MKELAGIDNPSYEDCAVVKCVCSAITRRAAKLTAAGFIFSSFLYFHGMFLIIKVYIFSLGLAVILKRMNKSEVTIAVDGSLFRYHPRLPIIMEETLKNLVSPLNKVNYTELGCF